MNNNAINYFDKILTKIEIAIQCTELMTFKKVNFII